MKYLFSLLLTLYSMLLIAQQLETADPQTVNVSEERLQRIDTYIQDAVEHNLLPGGVFLLARQGKIIYYQSFGNREANKPFAKNDIFRIASMTKAVTCVAIMQLFERGHLGLDDPVELFLPAFKEMTVMESFNEEDSSYTTVKAAKKITIRHLLTHTSGIAYGDFNPGKIMAIYARHNMLGFGLCNPEMTTEEFINKLARVPLAFEPGERFLYGLNMDVLGRVIEVVSGQSLSDYFQENIFRPLGMEDTYFYLPENKHHRLVPVQVFRDEEYGPMEDDALVEKINYPAIEDPNHYAGGGGLSSTALDYAKFIQMLLNDGKYNGNRLLNPQTMDLMIADQMIGLNKEGKGLSHQPGVTFGLGFRVYTEEAEGLTIKSPGTYEWAGYFNTQYFIDPEEELIFVGMTQIGGFEHGYFWTRLIALLYGALED